MCVRERAYSRGFHVSIRRCACYTSFCVYVNVLERAALMRVNVKVLDIAAPVCVYVNVFAIQAFVYT